MKNCKCGHPACHEDNGISCVTEGLTSEQWHDSIPYYRHKVKVLKEDLDAVKEDRTMYMEENFQLQNKSELEIKKLIGLVHNRRGALERAHYENVKVPQIDNEIRYLEMVEWGYESSTRSNMSFSFIRNVATVTINNNRFIEAIVVNVSDGAIIGRSFFEV